MDNKLVSWVDVPEDSDFTIYNLPFGIYSKEGSDKRVGVAIGNYVIDLHRLHNHGFFRDLDLPKKIFKRDSLNRFISTGKEKWTGIRNILQDLLSDPNSPLKDEKKALIPREDALMHLPVKVGDYTDFYSSKEHATNVGIMFRGPDNALMPNWTHLPVAYHGRSSSIVVSGNSIRRPKGQLLPPGSETPVFGESKLLDIELEMAFVVGKTTELGDSVSISEAEDHIFGMLIFNDWSARDIQKWEYVPLGPFLGKNFGSSVSPWIVTMEALDYFRTESPKQEPEVLPYLQSQKNQSYDINIEVFLKPPDGDENLLTRSNHKYLYWTMAQQLTHHTVNGCNIRVGDICASGTISGPTKDSYGSLLELTWRGEKPIKLSDGTERKFLLDNDIVIMRAFAERNGIRIGFGEVRTKILPAKS